MSAITRASSGRATSSWCISSRSAAKPGGATPDWRPGTPARGGAGAAAGGDAGRERGVAEAADVGDDALGDRVVAPDPGRVEVDVDERARDLDGPVAGGLLREARAEGDADVAGR